MFRPISARALRQRALGSTLTLTVGSNPQWKKYPLQIGRFSADAGYSVVKSGGENPDLIVSDDLRRQISAGATGNNNIKAGIAYLFLIY